MLFALDGTGNRTSGGPNAWTNVALMAAARSASAGALVVEDDTLQVDAKRVSYHRGVGTGRSVDRAIGGATGWGAKARVRRSYNRICETYADPTATADDLAIDIIGFSRGAATALHLANVIHVLGIRKPREPRRFNTWKAYTVGLGWIWFRMWERYTADETDALVGRISSAGATATVQPARAGDRVAVRIRFLGLFDAVSSFAVPVDLRLIDLQTLPFGFALRCPPNVGLCSHAIALDERRKTFRNVRLDGDAQMASRTARHREVASGFSRLAVLTGLILLAGLIPGLWGASVFHPVPLILVSVSMGAAAAHTSLASRRTASASDPPLSETALALTVGLITGLAIPAAWYFALAATGDNTVDWSLVAFMFWPFLSLTGPMLAFSALSDRRMRSSINAVLDRRFVVLRGAALLAGWALATFWLAGHLTPWWNDADGDPWPFIGFLSAVSIGLALTDGDDGGRSREPAFVAWTSAVVFGVGGVVRRLADATVDATPLRWTIYLPPAAVVATLVFVALWLERRHRRPEGTEPDYAPVIAEVWFRGNHTDVGGGGAPDLCAEALNWMIDQAAAADPPLLIDAALVNQCLRPLSTPPGAVGPKFDPWLSAPRGARTVIGGDSVHRSVASSTAPSQDDVGSMVRLNFRRLIFGLDLRYDPRPTRGPINAFVARRTQSPAPLRLLTQAPHPSRVAGTWNAASPTAD